MGTASHYFTARDDLLRQIDDRLHLRLAPDPDVLDELMKAPKDRALVVALMHDLINRVTHDRTGDLALLELRLEATRRPGLRESYTKSVRGTWRTACGSTARPGCPAVTRPSPCSVPRCSA